MKIRNSTVLPVMGVLTVIAGAVGLQLGESAIAQIDPIHFRGPATAARDVSRARRPAPAPTYASAYGWAEGQAAVDLDCGDCPALNARTAFLPSFEPLPPEPVPAQWEPPAPSAPRTGGHEERVSAAEWRDYRRYVHYPVTQDQAELADSLSLAEESPEIILEDAPDPAGL